MTDRTSVSDLDYIKDIVDRSDRRPFPSAIYLLWAVIVAVGFALVDFSPRTLSLYWMIMGPLGGIASGWIGHRYGSQRGQMSRELGIRHALHWGGMLVFTFLAVLLASTGRIPTDSLSQVILLIIAFGWWCAGVHFDRFFLWLGSCMALGFVVTLFVSRYAWTGLGLLLALALILRIVTRDRTHGEK